ncbi:hypothetical protein B0T22DRAFT_458978 [Podospora appendiculata]|uniref:Secreted protein n=1 Tax=Podospora appendiculata TaxID=314037 RepID=A0AAE1CC81_9PEZI|nr:hypothetical protein B0T22DRAFT_458978 [Podospora appendiculata]
MCMWYVFFSSFFFPKARSAGCPSIHPSQPGQRRATAPNHPSVAPILNGTPSDRVHLSPLSFRGVHPLPPVLAPPARLRHTKDTSNSHERGVVPSTSTGT